MTTIAYCRADSCESANRAPACMSGCPCCGWSAPTSLPSSAAKLEGIRRCKRDTTSLLKLTSLSRRRHDKVCSVDVDGSQTTRKPRMWPELRHYLQEVKYIDAQSAVLRRMATFRVAHEQKTLLKGSLYMWDLCLCGICTRYIQKCPLHE